ncbi:MAG: CDP-alcohol phosphatidyltransferase family protein [Planctomycetes bacterium]|nr:CDP-alcohol phosphatidyltransferase family protein [Planctomycetota bacterium]
MISMQAGRFFSFLRDRAAGGLLRLGVRPNALTVLGMLLTAGAGAALALGRACWPWSAVLLAAAGACDLLDGALAKLGRLQTRFGGVLDSVCDRAGDAALYLGPAFYFIAQPDAAGGGARPNLTLVFLACAGLVWAYLISYIRARAETAGARGGGGFWQRPERVVTILLGAAFGHVTTAVWILGLWPLATVAHRLWHARRSCAAAQAAAAVTAAEAAAAGSGEPGAEGAATAPGADIEPQGLAAVLLWRWPRGTIPFDVHAGAVILMLIFWDIPAIDPLRDLLARWQP